MHYHESKKLRVANVLCECFLILVIYWVSGLLRMVSPYGSTFFMVDIWRYFPLALLYSVVMVANYAISGSYNSLRLRSFAREFVKLAINNLVGFVIVASFIYVFRLQQFSRLLLGYFYLLSVVGILFKRVAFDKIATAYARKHHIVSRVLLVGNGTLAKRFYREVLCQHTASMQCVGYLADAPVNGKADYLGKGSQLHKVLEQEKIDLIVVAQDTQNAESLHRVVAVAESYRIRVCVVPVFNDFYSPRAGVSVLSGLHLVELGFVNTVDIMGVHISVTDMSKTVALIQAQLEEWRGKYICVANVHTTVTAHEDADYRKIQNRAVIALPDGGPLSKYSRDRGYAEAQRVTGPDLMRNILEISAENGWRHYFYGGTQQTLDILKIKLAESYSGVEVAGMYSPPFRDLTPQEDAAVVERINQTKPDFVWVGLGAPKQERWMAAHENRVHALMIGVGAAFDYEAGNIQRAPQWMQKANLEWFYRLVQDPKRLFKRYLGTNIKYLWWKFWH